VIRAGTVIGRRGEDGVADARSNRFSTTGGSRINTECTPNCCDTQKYSNFRADLA
jgi:hypothetical protein